MRWTSDILIGAGLTATLVLTVLLPVFGVGADYGKLQDTIAIGLVGFMGKAALPSGKTEEKKKEGTQHADSNT